MTKRSTDTLLRTGFEHLGRFAFYTRDNPFVSSQAVPLLPLGQRELLGRLLDGECKASDWLRTKQARGLLGSIKVGSVPRDVRLVAREGELMVGVESVHAFLHADLFWWMVSILWTITVADMVETLLGDGVMGFRFHETFLDDPATSGVMYRDQFRAHERWERFPSRVAADNPGEIFATNTLDIRAFYYSVDVPPGRIVSSFFKTKGKHVPQGRTVRVLTELLDALHLRFAGRCADVGPRRGDLGSEGDCPLPVGLPSSQVLANMVMSLALDDLGAVSSTVATAAYADDVIVMTRLLLDLEETPADYFERLGLASSTEPYALYSPSTEALAKLTLRLEKSGTSYSRHAGGDPEEEDERGEESIGAGEGNWDPYIDSGYSPDWGGRLRTVLRAPHRRDRVPRELRSEILRLLDEVRVGLPRDEARERFENLVEELDHGLFVALRPYWAELVVIGLVAVGLSIVIELTELLRRVSDSLEMPAGSTEHGRAALVFGLRASWIQALAQALAVATGPESREQLASATPELQLADASLDTRSLLQYAQRIRRRYVVPATFVAVPLAEFTAWEGPLIGGDAFVEFLEWASNKHPNGDPSGLACAVSSAVRFIGLHEACLAIHLWAGREDAAWEEESFAVLAAQPLVRGELIADLRVRVKALLGTGAEVERVGQEESLDTSHPLRIAMPSMRVSEDYLVAVVDRDHQRLDRIVADSRSALQKIVTSAVKGGAGLLVLPEWAIAAQLLPWLMEKGARSQMTVVGGGAPRVVDGLYLNRLWTGLPLIDQAGHRACLVPPPRQKRFLSPEERKIIAEAGIEAAPADTSPAVFHAGQVRLTSLICFEFADINVRQQLRFAADLITVSSFNHDWRYFTAIQDATTRDNYCLTVCVNTGDLPGTRIVRPTKSEMAVVASVHGADRPVVISKLVDLQPILAAQIHHRAPSEILADCPIDGVRLEDYKPFPPY